ncbi:MAG: glycosyltransferase [Lachnospiraceae bacterium]|nr:glycosyltransferase [Lachnospiraceae bacterium]
MMEPLVSVIIPVYHQAKDEGSREALEKGIAKVLRQSYRSLDILLVENGDQGDERLCDEIATENERVRAVHYPESISIGEARAKGIDSAEGEYITFLDADDSFYDDDSIKRMVELITASDGDVLVGDYCRLMGGRLVEARPHGFNEDTDVHTGDFRFRGFFSGGHLAYLWGKLYKMSYIREQGLTTADVTYGEDKSFSMCLYAAMPHYVFTGERFYIYTANASSESHIYRQDYREQWMGVTRHFEDYIKSRGLDEAYLDLSSYTILFSLIFHAKQEYENADGLSQLAAMKRAVRGYYDDPYCRRLIGDIAKKRYAFKIKSLSYRFGVRILAGMVSLNLTGLISFLLFILFSLGVDKKHSSTGSN